MNLKLLRGVLALICSSAGSKTSWPSMVSTFFVACNTATPGRCDCRTRNLKVFKREVKTGLHDVELPVQRWVDLLTQDTSNLGPAATTTTTVLRGSLFNRPVNRVLLHQVVRWQRAKRREVCISVLVDLTCAPNNSRKQCFHGHPMTG